MKKILAIVIVAMFAATSAFAETPTQMAVGYDGGLSMRYMAGAVGVQGILGLNFVSPASDAFDSAIDLSIGVNVFKCMWECDKGNLNGFAGIKIAMDGDTTKDSDAETDISVMAGLEPEIFLLDNLSVTTKFGLQIMIQGDQRGAGGKTVDDSGSMNIGTFGQGVSIVNGAAFNWYF
ncbi:MAG: hypothetical protein JXB48_11890 [Candidatus Latescibacteria bacterium]|nr:hypothetical protein [Candidatus Latescibacterota bacterium]